MYATSYHDLLEAFYYRFNNNSLCELMLYVCFNLNVIVTTNVIMIGVKLLLPGYIFSSDIFYSYSVKVWHIIHGIMVKKMINHQFWRKISNFETQILTVAYIK
jgi:hypothetical protein